MFRRRQVVKRETRMSKKLIVILTGVCLFGAAVTSVNSQEQAAQGQQAQTREQAFGWQLMSDQERQQYQQQMQKMNTEQEREAFRNEHHQMMQERARQQGVTLPDQPGAGGKRMGPGAGKGPGQGMGPGAGKGPGQGMGPGAGKGPGQGMGPGAGKGKGPR